MDFDHFYKKRRELFPGEAKYLCLCQLLNESMIDKEEVVEIFDRYLEEGVDFDQPEREEMVDYLYEVASRTHE